MKLEQALKVFTPFDYTFNWCENWFDRNGYKVKKEDKRFFVLNVRSLDRCSFKPVLDCFYQLIGLYEVVDYVEKPQSKGGCIYTVTFEFVGL